MGERPEELDRVERIDVEQDYIGLPPETMGAGFGRGINDVTWSPETGEASGAYSGDTGDITASAADLDTDTEISAHRETIEQTRAEMGQTIDEIQNRLSPETLAQQAKDTVREATVGKVEQALSSAGDTVQQVAGGATGTVQDVGSSIVDTIRQNPVPVALAGIGLGWLFMSMRKQNSSRATGRQYAGASAYGQAYGRGYGPQYSYTPAYEAGGYGYPSAYAADVAGQAGDSQGQSAAGQAVNQVRDTAGQAVNQVQDTAGQVASQVQNTAGQVVNQVQNTAGQVVDQAQQQVSQFGDQAQQAATGINQMMRENPLAVGAGALALGLAVGMVIPETQQEDQLMGTARESLTHQAQQVVQDTAQKVQSVAQEAVGAAKQEAQRENLM